MSVEKRNGAVRCATAKSPVGIVVRRCRQRRWEKGGGEGRGEAKGGPSLDLNAIVFVVVCPFFEMWLCIRFFFFFNCVFFFFLTSSVDLFESSGQRHWLANAEKLKTSHSLFSAPFFFFGVVSVCFNNWC